MQQLQVNKDELVEALCEMIQDLSHDKRHTDTLGILLQMEYLISSLYKREK